VRPCPLLEGSDAENDVIAAYDGADTKGRVMLSPWLTTTERGRLAAGLLILGALHLWLFVRGGNENATPARLLLSFVLSTTTLVLSQAVRRRLRRAPKSPSRPSRGHEGRLSSEVSQ
jgi:hypothetical protein